MPFTTPLRIELIDPVANEGQGQWCLIDPLIYVSEEGAEYVVDTGFSSDLASTPRLPFAYLLTGNTAHAPAALHDWLIHTNACPREEADAIFREAMESIGMPPSRIRRMYNAVRAHTENLAKRANPWGNHD
jgi:hypothetical protein